MIANATQSVPTISFISYSFLSLNFGRALNGSFVTCTDLTEQWHCSLDPKTPYICVHPKPLRGLTMKFMIFVADRILRSFAVVN